MWGKELASFETAFSKLDMNGDGILSQNEVLDIISQEDLKNLFFEMDGDGDGQIDYSVSSYKAHDQKCVH